MKLNKKLFGRSLYKIATILFLVGYNFAPSAFAIGDISKLENKESQSVSATIEDTSEDIHKEGVSDPEWVAKGNITSSVRGSTAQSTGGSGLNVSASSSGVWTWVDNQNILVSGTLNTNWIKWDRWVSRHSGLEFIGKDNFTISGENEFELATLKHHNYPVNYAIENAKLKVTITLGAPINQTKDFNMDLTIDETLNKTPCPSWHTPGHPACDDKITFPTAYSKEFFEVGDTKYVLEITGFIQGSDNVGQFITEEKKTNEAIIRGRLRSIPAKVTICHASDSHSNPYITHTPSANGHVDGHNGHNGPIWYPGITENWGDIIPEFRYFDSNGNVKVYSGKNNTEYGLSILENGCKFPEGKITVTKEVEPVGDSTEFPIVGSGTPAVADSPATFKDSNTGTISKTKSATFNVYPGTYSFTETVPTGWIEVSNNCNDIQVANGDEKSCIIKNAKASSITIIKHAEQVSDTSFGFTATGTGLSNFSLVDNSTSTDPEKVFTNLLPGNYSITENSKEGWYLKSATCNNGQSPDDLTLTAGSNVICTFTNTKYGSLTIVKDAKPSSTQEFSFTTTGTGLSDFTLVDNSDTGNPSKKFENLLAGTYSVAETVPGDWYLDSNICSDGSPITAIDLSAGEDITCTFKNIKYGSISGHKYHDLDGSASTSGDQYAVSGYTIFIDTNNNGQLDAGEPSTTTGTDGSYSFTNLKPGTYKIAEVTKIGWIVLPTTSTSQSVTLSAGEDRKNVNFINVEKPTIQVIKNVDTDGDGTADETNVSDWKWKIDNDEYGTGIDPVGIMPGTYTISEVQEPNYHVTSMICTNKGTEIVNEVSESKSITLKSGDKVVCTFTNARNLGKLIVKKVVVNNNGGTLQPKDFSFKIDGGTPIQFEEDGQNEFTKYAGLSYSITEVEANKRGYTTTYENCTDVTVPYNDTATCTITNTDVAPQLTVIKHVINEGNDGTKSAGDFAITVTGTNVSTSNFQGSEDGVTVTLNQGSFSVTEEEDTENYTATYEGCSGTINIGEKKTCTITNTGKDHKPTIEVTKEADKTSVDETGENVTFTFTVKNTSKVDTVEILSLIDSVFGDLDGEHACKVGTTLAPNTTCTFTITRLIEGDASGDDHYNKFTAEVKDEEGNETSDDDDETVTFKDIAPTLKVTKTVNDNSIPETGQEVTFTFTVKNTSKESVTITSLSDSVFGVLTGSDSCKVGTSLAPDAECSFTLTKTISGDYGTDHVNVFTAVVKDNDNTTATASDDETITFENVAPTLEVTKTVDDASIPETGQEVTFTFTVTNTSKESVTITSLSDDVFTTLTGSDDCKVGTVLPAGGSCSFTHTTTLTGDASGSAHMNTFTVTVEDNDGSTVTDSDDATVTFEDVKPSIEVLKTAGVSEIPETGGDVTFTYKVTNTGLEEVEITSLEDDKFGPLDGDDDCKVGTDLGAGESCEFKATFTIPANTPGDQNAPTVHKNIFTATAEDNEKNETKDDDEEEVELTPVPSLKLVKEVVHKYNSDETITAADWTLYANGDGGFSYAGDKDEYRFVKAGVEYALSESGAYSGQFEASTWTCTGGELTGSVLKLQAEDDVVCTITNTALPATIKIYKDVVDGSEDIYSNDIFKVKIVDGGEEKEISDTEENPLVAVFEGLDAGTYKPEEVDIPDGYTSLGCKADKTTVGNGETLEFVCTNKVIDPILEIEKSNDKQGIDQYAGNEVTYTIKVTAPKDEAEGTYVLNDVVVSDIAPAGFKYILGTWTAKKNGVDMVIPEPTYNGTERAQWILGEMVEEDEIVLTYKTKISLLTDPGVYPDIAWVKGVSLSGTNVLGNVNTGADTPFVGTDVKVIEADTVEEGEVLGASITLPNTGASTYLTLGALIMMILGLVSLLFKPFKKFKYALLASVVVFGMFLTVLPTKVSAVYEVLIAKIEKPVSPTTKKAFNIDFTAQDVYGVDIKVECYKNDVKFATFDKVNAGACPVTVDASGTYTFYVKAISTSGEVKSEDVTVEVIDKPLPVIDYSKAGNVLKFKTANDAKIVKVEIHRSDKPSYTANKDTEIHTMPVAPNTAYSWTDTTAEAGKTYYYALRTVDALGNVSTIVSDPEVVEVPTVSTSTATTTTTTTAATTGEVAGEKDTAEEGEVAGETDDVLEGEDKEVEKTEDEEEKTDIKETAKKAAGKWYIWVIAIVVIGGVAYYVRRQKRN